MMVPEHPFKLIERGDQPGVSEGLELNLIRHF